MSTQHQDVFTASGTFTPPAGVTAIDVLIVAGGGGGGYSPAAGISGGGGAGGVRWLTAQAVTPGAGCAVVVGAGGAGGTVGAQDGANGVNSSIALPGGTLSAVGGGGGTRRASSNVAPNGEGHAGGSGGGGGSSSAGGYDPLGGAGTAGQGNNGGKGFGGVTTLTRTGGGGGGAGAVGQNAASGTPGQGGAGADHSAHVGTGVGVAGWFGGGGGGADGQGSVGRAGGQGGGGAGSVASGTIIAATSGTANTGGGGGGAADAQTPGGTGGSGIVIVRYLTTDAPGIPTTVAADPDIDEIELTWAAPATGDPATGYDVRIDGGSPTDVGLVLTHTFTGLTSGTSYTVEVRAYNSAGDSSWVLLDVDTDIVGPTVAYAAKVRIGAHTWEIEVDDLPDLDAEPQILAGATFTWTAPDNAGWPPPMVMQPRDVVSLRIVAASADEIGDVQRGQVVRFKFTPIGYDYGAPLVDFAGRVQNVQIVDRPAGGVYLQVTAVDYLVDLANWTFHDGTSELVLGTVIGADDMGDDLTTLCGLLDDYCTTHGGFPYPAFGDVLNGITPDPSMFGFPIEDIVLAEGTRASALDAFAAIGGFIPWPNYDDDGDLDPDYPFLLYPFVFGGVDLVPRIVSAYGFDFNTADPISADRVPNSTVDWRRDYTPNVLETVQDGLFTVVTQGSVYGATPPDESDADRVLARTSSFAQFNGAGLQNELPEPDPWGLYTFLIRAWEDPETVRRFFTYPDRIREYITVEDIAADKDPNAAGTVSGMLKGATFVLEPGGRWVVTAGMRRSRPDMTFA